MNTIEYKIDRNNDIIFVNEEWDRFALDNYGQEITSEKILGNNLFDFIADVTVRHIYLDIIKKVREGNKISIDFRCDSPTFNRILNMTIQLEDGDTVKFISEAKKILPQNYMNVLDPQSERSNKLIPMCSWCKKIKMETEWEELEQAINKYKLLTQTKVPSITHTICEDCYQ